MLGCHAADWTNTRKTHKAIQVLAARGDISLDEGEDEDSSFHSVSARISDRCELIMIFSLV